MKSETDTPVEASAEEPAPTSFKLGSTPEDVARRLRVIDTETGDLVRKVIEANAEAGNLKRYELDKHGDLVRDGDHFRLIEEDRKIRIEWATGRQKASV